MGKFTHCCIVVGSTAKALAPLYQAFGAQAFIFQDKDSRCAICDDDDVADLDLVSEVTAKSNTIALLGQVFDSSVFVGTIYRQGGAVDEYIDYPEHFSGFDDGESVLNLERALSIEERATKWTALFGVPNKNGALAEVLQRRDKYVFAEDFHEALLEILELPSVFVGAEYGEMEDAYNSDPEARKALLHVRNETS